MKRLVLSLMAAVALCAPAVAADRAVHPRGRVARPDAAKVRRARTILHGEALKRLYSMSAPPAAFDSRKLNFVPPVQNQASCGSCWDFSGTGMVDICYLVSGIFKDPSKALFSEQYTLDCGRNGGCNGDDNTTVLDAAEKGGLPLTSSYGPYVGYRGRCKSDSAMDLYQIGTWGYVDQNGNYGIPDTASIKTAIQTYGCVGCAVAAGNGWDQYSGGVYKGSGNSQIDHDVILVGWDDSQSPVPGKTVWIMRNSWGASWGDGGYMYICEGADKIGTEAVWCTVTPPVPPSPPPAPPAPSFTLPAWVSLLLKIAAVVLPILVGGYAARKKFPKVFPF